MPDFKPTRHIKPQYVVDLKKIKVVDNVGIKETKEVLQLLQSCAGIAGEIIAGKFNLLQLNRLWQFYKIWRSLKKAIKGIGGVPKEILNLDDIEAKALLLECSTILELLFSGYFNRKNR